MKGRIKNQTSEGQNSQKAKANEQLQKQNTYQSESKQKQPQGSAQKQQKENLKNQTIKQQQEKKSDQQPFKQNSQNSISKIQSQISNKEQKNEKSYNESESISLNKRLQDESFDTQSSLDSQSDLEQVKSVQELERNTQEETKKGSQKYLIFKEKINKISEIKNMDQSQVKIQATETRYANKSIFGPQTPRSPKTPRSRQSSQQRRRNKIQSLSSYNQIEDPLILQNINPSRSFSQKKKEETVGWSRMAMPKAKRKPNKSKSNANQFPKFQADKTPNQQENKKLDGILKKSLSKKLQSILGQSKIKKIEQPVIEKEEEQILEKLKLIQDKSSQTSPRQERKYIEEGQFAKELLSEIKKEMKEDINRMKNQEISTIQQCEKLLEKAGVKLNDLNPEEIQFYAAREGFLNIIKFTQQKIGLKCKNVIKETLLHEAARGGDYSICEYLVFNNLSPSDTNNLGETPSMIAALEGH